MGAWTEIVDFTFSANETSRAFTGLNITKDDFIKVVMTQINGSSSNADIRLSPNTTAGVSGFDTSSNYHRQSLQGSGSSATATRLNINDFSFALGSGQNYTTAFFKLSENGKANIFTNHYLALNGTSTMVRFIYNTSSNLTFNDPITSLTFTSAVTNGIGTGSRIQIYRLDAEKVADITVASNTTQVDISDLSIGKDSEYLLVSDVITLTGGFGSLFVNDNTTQTNYYSQRLVGSGSTPSAVRVNYPQLLGFTMNSQEISYAFIKLSEIGAYTLQSYVLREYGTSSVAVNNFFGSSTAENITSITKLNIVASATNGIGSGSRFILYKLK